jgi:chorismate lyase
MLEVQRRAPAVAHWMPHVNAMQCSARMRDWLSHRESLTTRLQAHCQQFRVQRLYQGRAMVLRDEFAMLGLSRRQQVIEREVVLHCDEHAVVYAHTVLALSANASQWPLFASLGNRSLGTTLFNDPLVARGDLSYARLRASHPLMQRIGALGLKLEACAHLYARRSLFRRKSSCLLVTEVFLPSLSAIWKP